VSTDEASSDVEADSTVRSKSSKVTSAETGTARVKRGMAEMLKGGVIMDVVTPEQAKIAEDAGAVAVMALERVPADIRVQGGIARMSDPDMIDSIIAAVSIPVMAKARIGHFAEAQVLQAIGVDYIDESDSGIFKSGDPARRAAAIVKATTFYDDPDMIAKVSRGLGEAMVGINIDTLPADQHYASRGW
jgi:pyridoxal biosynthesis lyase PdxS